MMTRTTVSTLLVGTVSLISMGLGLVGCQTGTNGVMGCTKDSCAPGQICNSDGLCVKPPKTAPVTITKIGDGTGTVTSTPAGLDCGNTCTFNFEIGKQVTVAAAAAAGSNFVGFSIDCNSSSPSCTFTPVNADEPLQILVNFSLGGPSPLPVVCNSFGSCWENPKPQSNPLRRAALTGPGELTAVGDGGTVVRRSGGAYSLPNSGTSRTLRSVCASGTDLLAVGDGGTIVRYSGGVWSGETAPVTTDLRDVYCGNPSSYAVGLAGTILRRTGTSWSKETSNTTVDLFGVWGSGPTDLWAVGAQGTVVRGNGSTWTAGSDAVLNNSTLAAVAGVGAGGPVYAINQSNKVFRYSTGWSEALMRPGAVFTGLSVIGGQPMVVGGENGGAVYRFDGTNWQTDVSGAPLTFFGVAGTSSADLWAVGDGGLIWSSMGAAWQPSAAGETRVVRGVYALDANAVWAVGDNGLGLYYDGSVTKSVGSGEAQRLNAVWAADRNNAWAVGGAGRILRWTGTTWQSMTSPTAVELRGVAGTSTTKAWAVGDNTTILSWDGTSWMPATIAGGVTASMQAVWASGSEAWVAGSGGVVVRSSGGVFSAVAPGVIPAKTLGGIWGASASDVWVTADNEFYRYQGVSWTRYSSPVSGLKGIAGVSATEIYAVASGGVLLRFDGATWNTIGAGITRDLYGVSAAARKLWVSGDSGTLVRRTY